MKKHLIAFKEKVDNAYGKVGVPILMYFLGVPGILCVLVWFLAFRGK